MKNHTQALKKIINNIDALLDKANSIYNTDEPELIKINKLYDILKELNTLYDSGVSSTSSASAVSTFDTLMLIKKYIIRIQYLFEYLFNKPTRADSQFSQSYVNMVKKYVHTLVSSISRYNKIHDETTLELIPHIQIEDALSSLYTVDIITRKEIPPPADIINQLKDKALEKFKSPPTEHLTYNPTINRLGLWPQSSLLDEKDIPAYINQKGSKLASLKCSILVIYKHNQKGINYDISHLLDKNKSYDYSRLFTSGDGLNKAFINRNSIISYIGSKSVKWYYEARLLTRKEYDNMLILESPYPDKYKVLTYEPYNKPFLESILLAYNGSMIDTRITPYNKALESSILSNMFLPAKPDLDKLKDRSQVIDIKYFRESIKKSIISAFEKLAPKKLTLYTFNDIIHSDRIVAGFSDFIMNEYMSYILDKYSLLQDEHVLISDVISSFLHIAHIYERDFKKKLHDVFLEWSNNAPTDISHDTFTDMVEEVLQIIITNENNLFQALMYKVYLTKV